MGKYEGRVGLAVTPLISVIAALATFLSLAHHASAPSRLHDAERLEICGRQWG